MSHTRKRKIMANILKAEECFCFLKPVFPFYIFTKKKSPSTAGEHAACEIQGSCSKLTNLGSSSGHTHQQPGALRSLAIRWENLLFPCDSLELILR